MQAEIVLVLGIVLLVCGSVSLLIVSLYSPDLLGMNWISGCFAAGACTAGMLLVPRPAAVSVLGADFALLASLWLLHRAVLELTRFDGDRYRFSALLFVGQAIFDMLQLVGICDHRPRLTSIGIFVALQTGATVRVLWRTARKDLSAPRIFTATLLSVLATFNLARSVVMGLNGGTAQGRMQLSLVTFTLFIAVAPGLAFGFFWMTTAKMTAEITHLASTDPLTRVYNRRVFQKWCDKEIQRTRRTGVPFSLLIVDLDHFKRINDTFGHHRGDEILVAAVERMQDSVRGIDVLCRWGGEEFAVLLPNAPAQATSIVAERIRENIARIVIRPELDALSTTSYGMVLTASIGGATYRDLEDDLPSMFGRADRALYLAKSSGRNRVEVHV